MKATTNSTLSLPQSNARKLALAAVLTAGLSLPAQADPVELIYNIFIPPQSALTRDGLIPWAAEVERASNGTLRLTIPTSSVAPVPRLWDAVEDGIADIALVVNAFRSQQVALPTILGIPLVDGNAETVSRAYWETYEAHFSAVNEFSAFVPLAGFTTNGPHLMATRVRVDEPSDLNGLKVRVEGADQIALFENIGATPVGAPGLNSFELLTGGVVDAGLSPFGPAMIQGMVGVTNEITTFPGGFARSGFTLLINRERFESLPPEAQQALLSTSGVALSARLGAIVDAEEATGRAAFETAGATITEAGPELVDFVRAQGQFIIDNWLNVAQSRGLDGPAVLADYLARVEAGQ